MPKTATEQHQTEGVDKKDIRLADLEIEISASRLSVFPAFENIDAQHFDKCSVHICMFFILPPKMSVDLQNGTLDLQKEPFGHRDRFGSDFGQFWAVLGGLWTHLVHFWGGNSIQKSTSLSDVPKVAVGTEKVAILTLGGPRNHPF